MVWLDSLGKGCKTVLPFSVRMIYYPYECAEPGGIRHEQSDKKEPFVCAGRVDAHCVCHVAPICKSTYFSFSGCQPPSLRYTKAFREMFRVAAEARSEMSAMMALQIAGSSCARVDRRRCSASCNSVSSAFPPTSANASGISSSQGLSSPTSFVVV